MKKNLLSVCIGASLAVSMALPASVVSAGSVTLEGTNNETVTYSYSDIQITSSGGVSITLTDAIDAPSGGNNDDSNNDDSNNDDSNNDDSNVSVPDGVQVVNLSWAGDSSTTVFDLGRHEVIAFKTTTANSGDYRGFSTYFSASSPAMRSVWVSESPGVRDHLTENTSHCNTSSTHETALAIDTGTGSRSAGWRCQLEQGKTYYINVKAAEWDSLNDSTCVSGAGCTFTRSFRN